MNPFFTPPRSPSSAPSRDLNRNDSGATLLHDGVAPSAAEDEERDARDRDVHVLSARAMRDPSEAHVVHAAHEGDEEDHSIPGPGAILDEKYRIERVIGQGGMAVVLSAMHLHLDERVAIKLMLPQWAEDPELVERFMHEGRAATKIRSEHVVRVHDVGLVFERPYLVMEYLEGSDLDQLIAARGKLPVETAIDYLLQACEAIAEAHVGGIIHRDLKPANLFLTHRADGSACVKVLDFGISKRMTARGRAGRRETLPSMVMGSPHYMSPEQMQASHAVDERSDVWALGAILHELVAGTPPFQGETITALCAMILQDPPPPLTLLRADVPGAVEAVVLRCLEKDPARRFPNVAELAAALADLGSEAAQASAVRIARVLEGAADVHHAPMIAASSGAMVAMAPRRFTPPSRRITPNAVQLVDSKPRIPTRGSRALGYVVGAMALIAVGSGIGWMIVSRGRALEAAERAADERSGIAAPAAQPAIPPPPIVEPAGTTTLTNGSAIVAAPAASNATATNEAGAPVPTKTTNEDARPKNAVASAPQTRVHHTHLSPKPVRVDSADFPAPAARYVPSVNAAEDPSFAPSTPAATPAPSPTPSPDGEGLFEDRK